MPYHWVESTMGLAPFVRIVGGPLAAKMKLRERGEWECGCGRKLDAQQPCCPSCGEQRPAQ